MSTHSRAFSVSVSLLTVGIAAALLPATAAAQAVVSAHSGTVHYFEGDVSLDGNPVEKKTGRFAEMKEQGVLRTGQGRAEVLLTPGVFLRMGENSAIRLLDNRLVSTRVELMSGTIAVESDNPQMSMKDSPVTLLYKDYEMQMVKYGLIEVSTDPAVLKVYKGEAAVTAANSRTTVKEGRQLPFSAALLTEKFDSKVGDDLFLWSRDRSQGLSAASMSSARSLNSSLNGYGYTSLYSNSPSTWNGGWYFNPYFGMYTFLPGGDMFVNAFGYGFFSPYTIYNYYQPPVAYWYGGSTARGTGTIGRSLSGFTTNNGRVPLSTLRGGASSRTGGLPALGSPARTGGVVGAGSGMGQRGFGAAENSAMQQSGGFGGGGFGAASAGGGMRGGAAPSGGGMAGGGMRGGGGGGAAAAPAGGRAGR